MHRWGLGPIETSDSDANHDVLNATNDMWGMGPMETGYSGANQAASHAQNERWSLGPIETSNSDPKVAFCIQNPQMKAVTHRD